MGSAKTKSHGPLAVAAVLSLAADCVRGRRRNVLLALAVVGALASAAAEGWEHYGATHAHWETYSVSAADLRVTNPPPWVHGNVKGDVVRMGSLDRLSLLEHDTARQVAQAFALHPWVAEVKRVSKCYPARITVELAYRRPVAVVEVEHGGQPGLLPVDRDGILLPPEDFSAGQVKALPRIALGKTFPASSVGTAWGDDRVVAAALVAEVLCDDWSHMPLFQISARPPLSGAIEKATSFEIVARDGRRFYWGHAPGHERSKERTATEKRARLMERLAKPVDEQSPEPIDLST